MRTGSAKCVLVVNPEITSGHQAWNDRDCHFIFGDVCAAVIVERADTATAPDAWEVLGTRLARSSPTTSATTSAFSTAARTATPTRATNLPPGRPQGVQGGGAHRRRPHRGHLSDLGHAPTAVRRYWLHQANQGMNQLVIKSWRATPAPTSRPDSGRVRQHPRRVPSSPSTNTAPTWRQAMGVICSFGAGYSVGSVVLRKR